MKHFAIVAFSVLALCIAAQPIAVHAAGQKASVKTMKASGTVKSVSGTQLVVSNGGKDWTFTVDSSTKFSGKGLSTKSKGMPMAATDAVHDGDSVTVSYHDMNGTMHAARVSIRAAKRTMMKK